MATTQDDTEADAENDEKYIPDIDNNVDKRIKIILDFRGEMLRAYEIATAIDSTSSYTRTRCNMLWEDDELKKEKGGAVIGHPMPPNGNDIAVLEGNRGVLLDIVDRYGTPGQYERALTIDSIDELRNLIKQNIAIGKGHNLGTQKVSFGPIDPE